MIENLKEFLDEKANYYNRTFFIEHDPISIPHLFTEKEDIEIAGFLAATIAWGQRATILKNAEKLMNMMDNTPHDFVVNAKPADFKPFMNFVHRTFNGIDCVCFLKSLQHIYLCKGSLENIFCAREKEVNVKQSITRARTLFLGPRAPGRTGKHFSDPGKGAAAKRINMFLRWMVRKDNAGVDFGIWNKIKPSQLVCPLDVHSGNVARKLGLLQRKQNDWQAAEILTEELKKLDAEDPAKYDFALFGLGASGEI